LKASGQCGNSGRRLFSVAGMGGETTSLVAHSFCEGEEWRRSEPLSLLSRLRIGPFSSRESWSRHFLAAGMTSPSKRSPADDGPLSNVGRQRTDDLLVHPARDPESRSLAATRVDECNRILGAGLDQTQDQNVR
jgi:hypothetical protein